MPGGVSPPPHRMGFSFMALLDKWYNLFTCAAKKRKKKHDPPDVILKPFCYRFLKICLVGSPEYARCMAVRKAFSVSSSPPSRSYFLSTQHHNEEKERRRRRRDTLQQHSSHKSHPLIYIHNVTSQANSNIVRDTCTTHERDIIYILRAHLHYAMNLCHIAVWLFITG